MRIGRHLPCLVFILFHIKLNVQTHAVEVALNEQRVSSKREWYNGSIVAFQAIDPGSTPGSRTFLATWNLICNVQERKGRGKTKGPDGMFIAHLCFWNILELVTFKIQQFKFLNPFPAFYPENFRFIRRISQWLRCYKSNAHNHHIRC